VPPGVDGAEVIVVGLKRPVLVTVVVVYVAAEKPVVDVLEEVGGTATMTTPVPPEVGAGNTFWVGTAKPLLVTVTKLNGGKLAVVVGFGTATMTTPVPPDVVGG
jgi:hypothetical protein